MSVLSSTIKLNDYMTPALRHICDAVNQTVAVMHQMNSTMNSSVNTQSLNSARQSIAEANVYLSAFEENLRDAQAQLDATGRRGETAFNRLGRSIKNYITAYGVAMAGRWIIQTSDEMSMLNAKINMINNSLLTTSEMNNLIFQTAQNARASYTDMANTITRIQMNAGDAFNNTLEAVKFAEILNKQFKISGATMEETNAATLQLTQALGSGVLRGDELNSVFEAAPSILQAIADYMDVPIGKIRQLAKEGQITADVIKNAMLDPETIKKVNQDFSELPMTWQDLWTRAINNVKFGLMETSSTLSEIANSENMLSFIDSLAGITNAVATAMAYTLSGLASIANFAYENWSMIAPVLGTAIGLMAYYKSVVALAKLETLLHAGAQIFANGITWASVQAKIAETGAQLGLNSAIYACPLTWYVAMIILVVGAFFLIIAVINQVTGANISAVGVIVGAWYALGAILSNIFIGILNIASVVGVFIVNMFIAVATGVQNAFISIQNAAITVANELGDIFDSAGNAIFEGIAWGCNLAIDAINSVINLANKIPGVNISTMGHVTPKAVHHTKASKIPYKKANYLTATTIPYESVSGAYQNGYNIGKGWVDNLTGKNNSISKDLDQLLAETQKGNQLAQNGLGGDGTGGNGSAGKHIKDTANNTAKIAEQLKATGENIEYLRDLAEREVINRFTTAEIKIDMTNNNNISSDMDIDGVIRKLTDGVVEAMNTSAEGVHIA